MNKGPMDNNDMCLGINLFGWKDLHKYRQKTEVNWVPFFYLIEVRITRITEYEIKVST